jgi:triacylglycerol lipase
MTPETISTNIFVQLPPADYSRTAFDRFRPLRGGFDLDDARAMMWMSQLAYETHTPQTIAKIAPLWSFRRIEFVRAQARQIDTRAIIGERTDCIVVALAGTDPALSKNLMTDVDCRLTPNDTHEGFQAAIDAVWPQIETKITSLAQASPRPIYFAGYSLGAALAVLAADKAKDGNLRPAGVYTFGMPRTGGRLFKTRYNRLLGDCTYRLVYGGDTVACIPDSTKVLGILTEFQHVGRLLTCKSGNKFDRAMPLSEKRSNEPRFVDGLRDNLRNTMRSLLAGRIFAPTGPGALGRLFALLPFGIRDHLPDRYLKALEP